MTDAEKVMGVEDVPREQLLKTVQEMTCIISKLEHNGETVRRELAMSLKERDDTRDALEMTRQALHEISASHDSLVSGLALARDHWQGFEADCKLYESDIADQQTETEALHARLKKVELDTKRLDWLDKQSEVDTSRNNPQLLIQRDGVNRNGNFSRLYLWTDDSGEKLVHGKDLRGAIDAAIAAQEGK